MDLVALLNNEGLLLVASGEWDQACECYFEAALRILVSMTTYEDHINETEGTAFLGNNNINIGIASRPCVSSKLSSQTSGEITPSSPNRGHQSVENVWSSQLDGIIEFQGSSATPKQESANLFSYHPSQRMDNKEGQELLLVERFEQSTHLCSMETNGVMVDIEAIKKEMNFCQGILSGHENGMISRRLHRLLSTALLFNMALALHLSGLSQNNSGRLRGASRFYKRARLLLVSLKCCHYAASPSLMTMDVLYMACWNNDGLLAHGRADYLHSHHCFENLHTSALFYIANSQFLARPHNTPLDAAEGNASTNSIRGLRGLSTPSNSYYVDQQEASTRKRQHGLLEKKAYDFLLNAVCYRNTMMSPAA